MVGIIAIVCIIILIGAVIASTSSSNGSGAGKSNARIKNATPAFERAFTTRMGQSPVSYLVAKIKTRSDLDSIRYLFGILEAEIELKNNCRSPGFDFYYAKALIRIQAQETVSSQETTECNPVSTLVQVSKAFAKSQLIGKERFLQQYDSLLRQLANDTEFMKFVNTLRQELSGREVTETRSANAQIADYFYKNQANERFPAVKDIVLGVLSYGKQASAHISIYYAMFLYEH